MSALFGLLLVQIVSLSIVSANSDQTAACRIETVTINLPLPAGYIEYPNIHTAFKVSEEGRNWHEAKQACNAGGAFLAVVDTLEKVRYVGENQPQNADVWVGITRRGTDWVSADQNLRQSNLPWGTGHPNGVDDCVAVESSGTGLSSKLCSEVKPFVCELRTKLPEEPKIQLRPN